MLEERPILKGSIAGIGAFSFVFLTAMMGTAFMLTGGFGPLRAPRSTPPETRGFVVVEPAATRAWRANTDQEIVREEITAPAETAWLDDHEFQEAASESELAGAPSHAPPPQMIRSETDIAREIGRSFAADYTATSNEAWSAQRERYDAEYARAAVNAAYPTDPRPGLY